MNSPKWEFDEFLPKTPNQNPIQGEYFRQEALENAAEALVRESYQNTMDAKLEGQTAKIRVYFSGKENAVKLKDYGTFLTGLKQHTKAEGNGLTNPPAAGEHMDYFVIEDFDTTGLIGDVSMSDDPENCERQNFYYFWRNIGRSGKSSTDAGRLLDILEQLDLTFDLQGLSADQILEMLPQEFGL